MLASATGALGEDVEESPACSSSARGPQNPGLAALAAESDRAHDRAMIAAKPRPVSEPAQQRAVWPRRVSALILVAAILGSVGGGGLFDFGSAYSLEGRAQALQAR